MGIRIEGTVGGRRNFRENRIIYTAVIEKLLVLISATLVHNSGCLLAQLSYTSFINLCSSFSPFACREQIASFQQLPSSKESQDHVSQPMSLVEYLNYYLQVELCSSSSIAVKRPSPSRMINRGSRIASSRATYFCYKFAFSPRALLQAPTYTHATAHL